MNKFVAIGLLLTAATAGIVAYHMLHQNTSEDIPMISKSDMSTPEYDLWTHW